VEYSISQGVAILSRTPVVLDAMLRGLDPAWTDATEGGDTWSPHSVVGHLIHGERTDWIARVRIILAQGADRRFAPFDRTAQFRESAGRSLDELLDEFRELRAVNLKTLAAFSLTEAALALEGEHPVFGLVSLRQLLATWAAHDLSHTAQIARVMAKQYRTAVGPWREYLSIMDR